MTSATQSSTTMATLQIQSLPLSPMRVSMEEYYYNRILPLPLNEPTTTPKDKVANPPSYELAVTGLKLPPSRLKISPREDEGREILPAYSCSIKIQSIFQKKMELEGVQKAQDRNWYKVFLQLQGTALSLYRAKKKRFMSAKEKMAPPDVLAGELVKKYNLQHAEVGIAADYEKRRYVIRLRVEMDQFLLSCGELQTFLLWLESLSAAIDLAPPLDERKIPIDNSLPRVLRRRRRTPRVEPARTEPVTTGVAVNSSLLLQQPQVVIEQCPPLIQDAMPEHVAANRPSLEIAPTNLTRQATAGPSVHRHHRFYDRMSSSHANPSVSSETGKWKPVHQWSPMYDMMYAKRCMAILLSKSPRKTNLVILKGRQWVIDWATGALTRCDPPPYVEMESAQSRRQNSDALCIAA